MRKELITLLNYQYTNNRKGWYVWFTSKKNAHITQEMRDELDIIYPSIDNYAEKVYLFINNMKDRPVCNTCGADLKFRGPDYGYGKYCSYKCSAVNEHTKTLRKQTKLEKYGDENYNNPDKTTSTCKERYGSGRNNQKAQETMLERYGSTTYLTTPEINKMRNSKEIKEKIISTKRKNHTFKTSIPEEQMYIQLCDKYGEDDVIRNFNQDDRYPFMCDFYIKSLDKFIELNLHPTHGDHPFNKDSTEDVKKLEELKQANTAYSNSIIDVWTRRDVIKLQTAIENNLNYEMIYGGGIFYGEDYSYK